MAAWLDLLEGVSEPSRVWPAAGGFDAIVAAGWLNEAQDTPAALAALEQALRPGGVLLAVLQAFALSDRAALGFTQGGAWRLFASRFRPELIEVEARGSVRSAAASLMGVPLADEALAAEDEPHIEP